MLTSNGLTEGGQTSTQYFVIVCPTEIRMNLLSILND